MLIAGFPAGPWGTNCYLVATAPGMPCVVIDPGKDAAEGVEQVVREHDLRPAGVLLTHGHIDHIWCATPVASRHDVPVWIHPADRHLLTDPLAGISSASAGLLGGQAFVEPADLRELADHDTVALAGLTFAVDHMPGHTAGSVTFRVPYDEGDVPDLLFSGDVLFAGSIGRTDLPGGDHATMLTTLATRVLPLDDRIVVLPGHGAQTTIGRERGTNPFLVDLPATSATRGL
ncbi:MAG: MBL fold metallo-hydrolase [Actinomycetota bacterium]|nr:MBL fold metallo-hydrolase [Actinomycetota bacterium]